MKELLSSKLHDYITANNPDLLTSLQDEGKVTDYLSAKIISINALLTSLEADNTPAYIAEEACMKELTADLRPSRFNYLLSILSDEFEDYHAQLLESGILIYEVLNILNDCKEVFDRLGFSEENENNKWLHHEIIGAIKEYISK